MKYFVAIEEDLLQELWMHDPSLVVPFSRPFYPSELRSCCLEIVVGEQSLTIATAEKRDPDAGVSQLKLPGFSEEEQTI